MSVDKDIIKLLSTGTALHDYGIYNWAFRKKEAINVLDNLKVLNIPVLGGDVYHFENGNPVSTYDNWHCEQFEEENHEKFVSRSILFAKEYINKIASKDDASFFVIVPRGEMIDTDDVLIKLKRYWQS